MFSTRIKNKVIHFVKQQNESDVVGIQRSFSIEFFNDDNESTQIINGR